MALSRATQLGGHRTQGVSPRSVVLKSEPPLGIEQTAGLGLAHSGLRACHSSQEPSDPLLAAAVTTFHYFLLVFLTLLELRYQAVLWQCGCQGAGLTETLPVREKAQRSPTSTLHKYCSVHKEGILFVFLACLPQAFPKYPSRDDAA